MGLSPTRCCVLILEKIGKSMTIERAQELVSMKPLYERLIPQELNVRDSDVYDLLKGAIDVHVHGSPEIRPRYSIVETAKRASELGLDSIIHKVHQTPTTGLAEAVQQILDSWGAEKGIRPVQVYGGLVLNEEVGGLNPKAVQAAVAYSKCKLIWMPTLHSAHHRKQLGISTNEISVLTKKGELKPEVEEIIDILANTRGKTFLSTGHLSPPEILRVTQAAVEKKVQVMVEHVTQENTRLTVDEMRSVANAGALLGLAAVTSLGNSYLYVFDPEEAKTIIDEIGPEHIVLCSDGGQPMNPEPMTMFRLFVKSLLAQGVSKDDIRIMINANPRRLMGSSSPLGKNSRKHRTRASA
jgi:hypothetical protein